MARIEMSSLHTQPYKVFCRVQQIVFNSPHQQPQVKREFPMSNDLPLTTKCNLIRQIKHLGYPMNKYHHLSCLQLNFSVNIATMMPRILTFPMKTNYQILLQFTLHQCVIFQLLYLKFCYKFR